MNYDKSKFQVDLEDMRVISSFPIMLPLYIYHILSYLNCPPPPLLSSYPHFYLPVYFALMNYLA